MADEDEDDEEYEFPEEVPVVEDSDIWDMFETSEAHSLTVTSSPGEEPTVEVDGEEVDVPMEEGLTEGSMVYVTESKTADSLGTPMDSFEYSGSTKDFSFSTEDFSFMASDYDISEELLEARSEATEEVLDALKSDTPTTMEFSMGGYEESPEMGASESVGLPGKAGHDAAYYVNDLEVHDELARNLLRKVYAEIEKRHQSAYEVEQLVIGLPQYKVLYPWCRAVKDCTFDELLTDIEVIVVPGPALHAVIPNIRLLDEHLREQE